MAKRKKLIKPEKVRDKKNTEYLNVLAEDACRPPTEHEEQVMLVDWWALVCTGYGLPEWLLYAVPNGGVRHIGTAKKLKKEGVRSGVPDLCLACPMDEYHGLYIELKRIKGSSTSKEQKAFHLELLSQGYACCVCRGFEAAKAVIEKYLNKS